MPRTRDSRPPPGLVARFARARSRVPPLERGTLATWVACGALLVLTQLVATARLLDDLGLHDGAIRTTLEFVAFVLAVGVCYLTRVAYDVGWTTYLACRDLVRARRAAAAGRPDAGHAPDRARGARRPRRQARASGATRRRGAADDARA